MAAQGENKQNSKTMNPRTKPPTINLPLSHNKNKIAAPSSSTAGTTSKGKGSTKTDKSGSRPCPEHSFLTDVADVRKMEQGLLQLLDDFHSGKLQAFGKDCTFEKMDQIREQQERLAKLHFELDSQQEVKGLESSENRETSSKNLNKLMDNLHELCTSIQNLQKDQPGGSRS